MEITARLQYMRLAPRKMRLGANLLKGMPVSHARRELMFLSKHAAEPLLKLLHSAVANAKHNFSVGEEKLYVEQCLVNSGPVLKRTRPRAFGRAAMIRKRMSHVVLTLATIEDQEMEQTGNKISDGTEEKPVLAYGKIMSQEKQKEKRATWAKSRVFTAVNKKGRRVRKMFNRKVI